MRPQKLKILGRLWEIEYSRTSESLGADEIGCSDIERQHITVKEGLKPEQEKSTLLHEVIHAGTDTLGLKLTESQVQGLETFLYSLNKDNPKFFSYLKRK